MTQISVDFHGTRTFQPGETLHGELVIETPGNLKCKDVLAKLQCYAHGYGNSAHQEIAQLSVFSGELPAGTHRFPFEFVVPAGPYTYHGHYTNLEWGVQGYIDIPWAIDKKHREDFILSSHQLPVHIQEQLPIQPDAAKKLSSTWWLLGGSALLGLAAFFSYGFLLAGRDMGSLICAIIALVAGAIIFRVGALRFLASRVITATHITLTPWPLRPAQASTYHLKFTPATDLTINLITIEIQCNEVVIRGSGTNKTTHTHLIYNETFTLAAGTQHSKGKPVEITHEFTLPNALPPSFELPNNRLVWTLITHIDIPNWPDWKDTHEIHMGPSLNKELTHEPSTSAPGPSW